MRLYLIFLIAQISGVWRLKKDFSEYDLELDNTYVEDTDLNKNPDAPESINAPEKSDNTYVEDTGLNKNPDAPENINAPENSDNTYFEDTGFNTNLDAPESSGTETFNGTDDTSQNSTFRLHYFFIKYFFIYVFFFLKIESVNYQFNL